MGFLGCEDGETSESSFSQTPCTTSRGAATVGNAGLTQRATGMHWCEMTSAAVSNRRHRVQTGEDPLLEVVEYLLSDFG